VVDRETLDAIRHHHEYLDGSGYPDGLAAQQIGDLTRIMTVCDIYGALVERRAYKAAKSPEAALDILTNMAKDGKVEGDLVRALRYCVAA
jgi:HD-GYP domain-containing protein (c-di-GMP phosphodiesterase class II)